MKKLPLSLFFACVPIFLYTQSIQLDQTFGANGILTFNLNSNFSFARDIYIQNNGQILVTGYTKRNDNDDFALIRIDSFGVLDSTFGLDGKNITNFPENRDDQAYSVLQLNDSSIFSAGISKSSFNWSWGLSHYLPNGTTRLKTSFTASPGNDTCYQVLTQPDGKILIAGWDINRDFLVVRLLSQSMVIDFQFGQDGKASFIKPTGDRTYGILLQADGKIVAFGGSKNSTDEDFSAVRFHSNGGTDTTFGQNGIFTQDFGHLIERATAGVLTKDEKIILAGDGLIKNRNGFNMIRLTPLGELDTTFGENGVIRENFTTYPGGKSLVELSDDKILAVGSKFNGSNDDFALTRFNSNGQIDSTFGQNGILLTDFGGTDDRAFSVAYGSLTQSIVVVGESVTDTSAVFAIAKYSLDTQVGIKEFPSLIRGVKVYPNPSISESQLYFYLKSPEYISIDIIDIQGRLVKQIASNQFFQTGNHTFDLPLRDLIPGTYNLQLRNRRAILETERIVIRP